MPPCWSRSRRSRSSRVRHARRGRRRRCRRWPGSRPRLSTARRRGHHTSSQAASTDTEGSRLRK
eukprot:5111482-Pleurochrysis_carterae.AAC.1